MTANREQRRFNDVVVPHLDDALSLARWLTGSVVDAEDVVQDACIRAFGAINAHNGGNPRAWLLSIVRNTAFTWMAKNRPKMLVVTDDERVFEMAAADMTRETALATPEAEVIARDDAAVLNAAIAGLPLTFRETLVLREIEGLSYREISEITAAPIGTVMSRLARARGLLLAAIGEAMPHEGRVT